MTMPDDPLDDGPTFKQALIGLAGGFLFGLLIIAGVAWVVWWGMH